jgi:hypothetical protein
MNQISSNRFVQPIYRPRPVSGYQYTGERLSKAIKEGRKRKNATEITEKEEESGVESEERMPQRTKSSPRNKRVGERKIAIKKATMITEKEEDYEKKTGKI